MTLTISQEYLDKLQEVREIEGIYLANSLQQGFIYSALNHGNLDDAYVVQVIWQYNVLIDIHKLKEAWDYAQKRYSSLRLRFSWDEELVQVIDKKGNLDWRFIDLSKETSISTQDLKIKEIQEKDRIEPYKLEQGSLFRVYLIKQRDDLYTCLFSNHHSILDGWSVPILLGYIHEIYLKLQVKDEVVLTIDHSYKDSQRYIQEHRLDNKVYWEEYISKIEEQSNLSGLLTPSSRHIRLKEYKLIKNPEEEIITIRGKFYTALKELGKNEGVTLNAIAQYVWHKILSIYGNSNQTVAGVTASGRNLPLNNIESSVGLYINTLPLIVDHQHSQEKSIIESIKDIQDDINDINTKSIINLSFLQKRGERLFESIFIYENYPNPTNDEQQKKLKIKFKGAKEKLDYPLVIIAYEDGNELIFKLIYAGELFSQDSIVNLLSTSKKLLEQIVSNPTQTVQSLSYLSPEEYEKLIYTWNQTDEVFSRNEAIHELFEKQVEQSPDNIAVIYEDHSLTYRQLNERSNQLARYLRSTYDIKPDSLIGLCLERNEHLLIAILAVLKSGGAYVPIDPSYPAERMKHIIEDTNTPIVLTTNLYIQQLENLINLSMNKQKTRIVALDNTEFQKKLAVYSRKNIKTNTSSDHLAYVIYTSGTTGKPKGVMIEHKSYLATIESIRNSYFSNQNNIRTYSVTNYVFDIFGLEYGLPLLSGGAISLGTHEFNVLDCTDYDFVQMTPSLCALKLDSFISTSHTKLFIGGENLNRELLNKILNKSINLINFYGPTETTIWSTGKLYTHDKDKDLLQVTLGKPLGNEKAYVLDTNLNPLPIGATGELYIGGIGLARGYLNQPDLTMAKFIKNPFQSKEEELQNKNEKIYKTGDLARWLPDGTLEYMGRNDFQVKIRGHRIELEEIENTLLSYPDIRQTAVVVKEHLSMENNKFLIGYYVSDAQINEEILLSYLSSRLPEHMVPSFFVYLDKLPLTPNGKLDRGALPEPGLVSQDEYIEPRTELERKMWEVWGEVLGIDQDKFGIRDNFFRLGGNSVLAIKLTSKANKELKSNITVSEIFKHNTIEKLVQHLESNVEEDKIIEVPTVEKPEEQSLSFAQERLWFVEKYEEGSNAYNIPMIFKLAKQVNLDLIERSIKSIVSRHEILRTLIKEGDEGKGYQLVCDEKEYPLTIDRIKVSDQLHLDKELEKQVNHIYDLAHEYPIKVCVYELSNFNDTEFYISIVIHHIAFDGWSIDIFVRELQSYYNYYLEESQGFTPTLNLSDLPIQYKDFALWQRSYLNEERVDKQLNYWKSKLEGYETLSLSTDKGRPVQVDYRGKDISFEIDEDTSRALRELAKELKVSLYSLLLGSYYLMLKVYSNQDDIVIGTPVANRHYSQVESLIGFFVNSLALRIQIDLKESVKEFIQRVGEEVVEAQLHQDLPFEKLVEELRVPKDTSRHPIFQVMFDVHDFGGEIYKGRSEKEITDTTHLLQSYAPEENVYNIAKFDISTFIDDSQVCLRGGVNYAVSLYDEETIHQFIRTYTEILKQLAGLAHDKKKQEQTKLFNLRYVNPEQHQQLIYTWNQTDKAYPDNKTIHELFEEQVERTPDSIAVVYEHQQLTYQQLNEKSNQLANYLRRTYDITPDTFVALCIDRSEHMLIAILSILKAGGAYVPIDPSYPNERIKYILEDTNAKIILTNEKHQEKLKNICEINLIDLKNKTAGQSTEILAIDSEVLIELLSLELASNLHRSVVSTDLAYTIYTSGTTGNPKGVMIEHKAYVATINCIYSLYFTSQQKISTYSITNYVFDIFGLEYGLSLLSGGVISIGTSEFNSLDCSNYNFVQMTPSLCDLKLNSLVNTSRTKLFIGGESLSKLLLNKVLSKSIDVVNVYGPTETTIWSTSKLYTYKENLNLLHVSLGKPFHNEKAYILDINLSPLPIGAIGELYIGGEGLARGYWKKPDLTAEKFIANPFQTGEEKIKNKNTRLYKSGDLVRWSPDGNLEYIGRNDFQVKVRGHRIELGEVETTLSAFAGIKQSIVLATENKNTGDELQNKYLLGYYVSSSKLDEEEILNYLRSKLPEYMVPSILVHLEKLPLTVNGKLNRKALPDPEFTNSDNYVAPRNELENVMCQIWAEVLGLEKEKVGIRDDFFRLGGDSILAIRLISKLNKGLNSQIRIKEVFELKSISKLAEIIPFSSNYKEPESYVPFSLVSHM